MTAAVESGAEPQARRGRRGGREARREIRSAFDTKMLPALKRNLPLVEPMSQEQIEKIDDASMSILEDVGVIFRDPVAIADWKRAGADIRDGDRVRKQNSAPTRSLKRTRSLTGPEQRPRRRRRASSEPASACFM